MKISKALLFVLFILLFSVPLSVSAQFPPDPGGDPDEPEVPIDGGLSLLLAAGVGYGVKKAHEARKNKDKEKQDESI